MPSAERSGDESVPAGGPVSPPAVRLSGPAGSGGVSPPASEADWGGLLFLLSLVLGGIGVHRLSRGTGAVGLLRATMVVSLVLVLAYVVAVWAMTGKPD